MYICFIYWLDFVHRLSVNECNESSLPVSVYLHRSQSRILPWTVSLTICDCRPIRCTSHGPVYGYLCSFPRIAAAGLHSCLSLDYGSASVHITRRTDPARLVNNGRGLRSDHNRERRRRSKKKRLRRRRCRLLLQSPFVVIASAALVATSRHHRKIGFWFMQLGQTVHRQV